MGIYDTIEDFERHESLQKKLTLIPRSLQRRLPDTGWSNPEDGHSKLQDWLNNKTTVSPDKPVVIGLGRAYLEYPIFSDGAPFANNFGKILKFSRESRYLAAAILYSLSKQFSFSLNPSTKSRITVSLVHT